MDPDAEALADATLVVAEFAALLVGLAFLALLARARRRAEPPARPLLAYVNGGMSAREATRILAALLDALEPIHRAGRAHGRLSAASVQVTRRGELALVGSGAGDRASDLSAIAALGARLVRDPPPAMRAWIRRGTSPDPARRFRSIEETRVLLEFAMRDAPDRARTRGG
ncbi:MAG: protein kinase family protein [Thermoplasmatota archaeon]